MAAVYILSSKEAGHFYIGSCMNIELRLAQHKSGEFTSSFTSNHTDWELFYMMDGLDYGQSRKIEAHIKRMKSRKYIENLSIYPEIMEKLLIQYQKE